MKKIICLVKHGIRKNIKSWLTESEEKDCVDEFIALITEKNVLITEKNIAVIVGILLDFKNILYTYYDKCAIYLLW